MKVLVIFESFEGQTEKIAHHVGEATRQHGHDVTVVDVGRETDVAFDGVGAVVLAAPVHQRRHPPGFEAFLQANRQALADRRTLMLSVSLSASFAAGLEEAQEYLVEMKMRTGLEPDAEALVAGAIRVEKYDYFALQVIRHVILRGREFDPAAGDHEFTDWDALKATLTAFLQDV